MSRTTKKMDSVSRETVRSIKKTPLLVMLPNYSAVESARATVHQVSKLTGDKFSVTIKDSSTNLIEIARV